MIADQSYRLAQKERALIAFRIVAHHFTPGRELRRLLSDPTAIAMVRAMDEILARGDVMSPERIPAEMESFAPDLAAEARRLIEHPAIGTMTPEYALKIEEEIRSAHRENCPQPITPDSIAESLGRAPEPNIGGTQNENSETRNPQNPDSLSGFGVLGVSGEGDYPIHVFPAAAREMAEAAAAAVAVPDSMTATSALGVVSSAVGAGLRIRTHAGETGANLYLLVGAQSGTGKDQSLRHLLAPLAEIDREAEVGFERESAPGLRARRAVLERNRSAKGNSAPDEIELERVERELAEIDARLAARPQLIVNDTTTEALGALMAQQPGEAIASITTEARHVFGLIGGRYRDGKASDEGFYCASFSGSPIRVNRRGAAPYRLDAPCLTCLWFCQPDVLRSAFGNPTMIESGLLPRLLFFDPNAEPAIIPPGGLPQIPPDTSLAWRALIRELVEVYRAGGEDPKTVELTEEALDLLLEFSNATALARRSEGDLSDIASFVARWGEIAYRVALCLHAIRYGGRAHEHRLEAKTASDAIALLRWHVSEILTLLDELRSSKNRDRDRKLLELLADASGELTMGRLKKYHGFSEADVKGVTDRTGKIEVIKHQAKGGGRPTQIVRLINP